MDRRSVIKNLALVIGGTVLFPSCLHKDGAAYVQLKHIRLNSAQQGLIADMAETIIPKTNTPGAKDINLHLFVLKMLDDCYNKKAQGAFLTGLVEFNDLVKKKYNKDFSDLSTQQREAVLTEIENDGKTNATARKIPVRGFKPQKNSNEPPLKTFYRAINQQTIFGYTTSQYFMTKQIVYELVPGRYNAHFPVKNIKSV